MDSTIACHVTNFWRLLQCIRRYYDNKRLFQLNKCRKICFWFNGDCVAFTKSMCNWDLNLNFFASLLRFKSQLFLHLCWDLNLNFFAGTDWPIQAFNKFWSLLWIIAAQQLQSLVVFGIWNVIGELHVESTFIHLCEIPNCTRLTWVKKK